MTQRNAFRWIVFVLLCCAVLVGASSVWARQAADASPAYLVKDIGPGSWDGVARLDGTGADLLFFLGNPPSGEEWVSDGTEAGTMRNTLGPNGSPIYPPASINGTWYFAADDGVHGYELWSRPAAGGQLNLVKDIASGSASSLPGRPILVKGRMLFTADDGIHGRELWTTDGTEGGTYLVKDIRPGPEQSDFSPFLFVVNNRLFFFKTDGVTGYEPWVSDGTQAGTHLLKDINPGAGHSVDFFHASTDGKHVFFNAMDGDGIYSLWVSDGTPEGTIALKQGDAQAGFTFVTGEQRTYFLVGREIWITDGTRANTRFSTAMLPDNTVPDLFVVVNNVLFFRADTQDDGQEVWTSDGTPEGTHILKDIAPGEIGSEPGLLADVEGTLVFRAGNSGQGYELWQSDGTAAGTTILADVAPGHDSSFPYSLMVVGSHLLFDADDGIHGRELWAVPLSALTKQVQSPIAPLPPATTTPIDPTPTPPLYTFSHFLPLMQGR